jgi:hypothetical protein
MIYLRVWPFSAPNQTFSCTESFQLEKIFQIEDDIQRSPLLPVKLDAEAALQPFVVFLYLRAHIQNLRISKCNSFIDKLKIKDLAHTVQR